jgi:hypothetical protein
MELLRELLNRLEDSLQEIAPRCRTAASASATLADAVE